MLFYISYHSLYIIIWFLHKLMAVHIVGALGTCMLLILQTLGLISVGPTQGPT